LVLGLGPAFAQDDPADEPADDPAAPMEGEAVEGTTVEGEGSEEDDSDELKFAGTPYPYYGPDTGVGFGFSIMFRDLFDKKGRDATFSASYTESQYQDYSVDWQEPDFPFEGSRFRFKVAYSTKPAMRFNGIGNDTRHHNDSCNIELDQYSIEPSIIYRFPKTDAGILGMRFNWLFQYSDASNGDYDDEDAGGYGIPIRNRYPEFYRTDDFDELWIMGPSITVYLDAREDRFPLGGGREEVVWPMKGTYSSVSYQRIDEAFGADVSFNSFGLDLRTYFPLFAEDTIVALRFNTTITQGDVPFYKMPTFGSSTTIRAYYWGRFLDKNSTLFQVELRQGLFPDQELPLFDGAIKLKYPSIAIFWDEGRVHEDYTRILEDMWEDNHYTYGFGFRFIVTPSVVIRFDWAYSDEQSTFNMTAGLPI